MRNAWAASFYTGKCLHHSFAGNGLIRHRFERQQYLEVREGWNAAEGELAGKTAVTTYGAEHFCRLLGKKNLSHLSESS